MYPLILEQGPNMYKVLRVIPKHNFINTKNKTLNLKVLKLYQEYFNADKVVQNSDKFIFVENIPEIEYEEINIDNKTLE